MLYTTLPNTNLKPSVLCLGTGSFGSEISTDDSFAMLDAFAEAGGNFADSAHVYAAWIPGGAGASERTLGQWLASRKPKDFIVSTKGGHPNLDTMEISRLSPPEIAQDIEESLERLGVDAIDLYWLHRDDESIPVEEIIFALNEHAENGRLKALGASNWSTARIAAANEAATRHGLIGFCASQIGWSLAETREEVRNEMRAKAGQLYMDDETLAWHRASGFPGVAYSAQANGFFTHPLPEPGAEMTDKQKALAPSYLSDRNRLRYTRAQELARELGCTANEIALSYLWSQEFPAVAIVGPRRVEQLAASLEASDLRLSPEQVALLTGDEHRA